MRKKALQKPVGRPVPRPMASDIAGSSPTLAPFLIKTPSIQGEKPSIAITKRKRKTVNLSRVPETATAPAKRAQGRAGSKSKWQDTRAAFLCVT